MERDHRLVYVCGLFVVVIMYFGGCGLTSKDGGSPSVIELELEFWRS